MRVSRRQARKVLREVFGLDDFRAGQWEAISALLSGRDVAAIFPTGAGKSLCYQLPALMFSGLTLVISPLISLMADQVASLARKGITAVTLNSLQTAPEREQGLAAAASGEAKLLYVAPERLNTRAFQDFCRSVTVSMVVVDEAHCVAQWGDSFRPAYGDIGPFVASLPHRPVVCAMTATTDRKMLREITARLGMNRPAVLRLPLIRPNLNYRVITTLRPEREIVRLVRERGRDKGIVFCTTRLRAEQLAQILASQLRDTGRAGQMAFYHAGLPREEREDIQRKFTDGTVNVLCATSAFGMGVDIPDIRYVIHDAIPADLTDYAQQSGRAGRDGLPADCIQLIDLRWIEVIRRRYQRDQNQMARGWKPRALIRRFRQRAEMRGRWRKQRAALSLFLGGECIPMGLSRHFGLRAEGCGHCERCAAAEKAGRWVPLAPVPELPEWDEAELRRWALTWQRDALARAAGRAPGEVLSGHALDVIVRYGVIPAELGVLAEHRPAFERILRRLMEERHQTELR